MEFIKFRELNQYTLKSVLDEKLWLAHPDKFSDDKESIRNYDINFGREIIEKVFNENNPPKRDISFYERLGICSLTHFGNLKNEKMWEEYGANGKGIVLVYEFSKKEYYSNIYLDEFYRRREKNDLDLYELNSFLMSGTHQYHKDFYKVFSGKRSSWIYPVRYYTENEFEDMRYTCDLCTLKNDEDFFKMISHLKQEKFRFELEWRLLNFFPYSIKEKGGEYIDKKISRVILGKKVLENLLKKEKNILSKEEKEIYDKIYHYCKKNKIPINVY